MPPACTQDFVSAVMDVDYNPTGREFVAGGYDRSVRIFAHNGGHSREVRTARTHAGLHAATACAACTAGCRHHPQAFLLHSSAA